MSQPKNINLFLMDGDANGRIKCTLSNWTGITYKIPRTMLDKAKDIAALNQTGVYMLFGFSEETGDPVVYVGQAGTRKNGKGIIGRLDEHRRSQIKDYWTEAVVFITSNNSFGPTEISYLENRFYNMALEAKRYIVQNDTDPHPGNITEEKESELNEFIAYARLVIGALGFKVFEPLISRSVVKDESMRLDEEPLLYFKTSKAEATGKRTSEGFVVLSGSQINVTISKSCPESAKKAREKYKSDISIDGFLSADVLLSSPSTAASFVGGSSLSGNMMWKTDKGLTLKDLEENELSCS